MNYYWLYREFVINEGYYVDENRFFRFLLWVIDRIFFYMECKDVDCRGK